MKTILIKAGPLVVATALLSSCAASPSSTPSPVSSAETAITSCGIELSIPAAPKRAIALEQGATEVMLALGLEGRMIGTSYLTDAVAPEYQAAYDAVPVLAAQYPTTEQVREAGPDFVYSMRASAFSSDAAGSREELIDLGVPAYLSSNDCEDQDLITDEVGFDQIFAEVQDIASIFDVPVKGDELVADQQAVLDDARARSGDVDAPSIVWLYSSVEGAPVVAGANGLAHTLGELAGGTNAFDDLDAQWTETTWDEIAQRDPDVIVVADLSRGLPGDSAADKIESLRTDAVTAQLSSVMENRLISIPATELDPSVRSIDALQTLSTSLTDFAGGTE